MVDNSERTERNRRLVHEYFTAFSTRDPAQFEHLLEEDAYYRVGHNEYRGREGFAVISAIGRFLYPNGNEKKVDDLIVEGDKAAARVTIRAVTNKGEDYENYYAFHFLFSDEGRIAELYEFTDSAYAHSKFSFDGVEDSWPSDLPPWKRPASIRSA